MGKLVFANQLRGVAALFVLVSHYFGVYWGMREAVAGMTFSPVLTGETPAIAPFMLGIPGLSYGPFGVGLFFLISGFVIPFSLGKVSRLGFGLNRLFRIFPTYLACFAIVVAVLWGSAHYWHQPFTHSPFAIASNALLVHDLAAAPSIDAVNWTLMIELKYYLAAALFAPWLVKGKIWPLLLVSGAALAFNAAATSPWLAGLTGTGRTVLDTLGMESMLVGFMGLGTLFHYRLKHRLPLPALGAGLLALTGLFLLTWKVGTYQAQFPIVTLNYVYALGVFGLLYAVRNAIKPFPPLDWLAAISYPLYLVHSMVGYVLMRLLAAHGVRFELAVALAFGASLALAWLVHRTVETPSLQLGKKLAAFAKPPTLSPSLSPSP